jgi:hypothetical protein
MIIFESEIICFILFKSKFIAMKKLLFLFSFALMCCATSLFGIPAIEYEPPKERVHLVSYEYCYYAPVAVVNSELETFNLQPEQTLKSGYKSGTPFLNIKYTQDQARGNLPNLYGSSILLSKRNATATKSFGKAYNYYTSWLRTNSGKLVVNAGENTHSFKGIYNYETSWLS